MGQASIAPLHKAALIWIKPVAGHLSNASSQDGKAIYFKGLKLCCDRISQPSTRGNQSPDGGCRAGARSRGSGQHGIFCPGIELPLDPLGRSLGLLARRAQAPVQTVLLDYSTPYLGKHWPLWRPPVLPLSCRVRVGQRWAVLERPQQFGPEIEAYFREAIDPAANQLPDARE